MKYGQKCKMENLVVFVTGSATVLEKSFSSSLELWQ